jgi:hypothetical protein
MPHPRAISLTAVGVYDSLTPSSNTWPTLAPSPSRSYMAVSTLMSCCGVPSVMITRRGISWSLKILIDKYLTSNITPHSPSANERRRCSVTPVLPGNSLLMCVMLTSPCGTYRLQRVRSMKLVFMSLMLATVSVPSGSLLMISKFLTALVLLCRWNWRS